MATGLQLRVLGPFELERNGRLVTRFESDKARALLAYLALEPGHHSREALCALLWPELDAAAGRHNLSQSLFSLRQLLAGAGPAPLFLVDRYSVQLDPAVALGVDAREFSERLGACRRHAHDEARERPELCADCATWRRQAVGLYRGNLLAGLAVDAGEAFDGWLTVEQERFHRQTIEALDALARYHEWRGELQAARDQVQRQVELEPWREEAHRQLMRLLAHSGERSAALRQYQLCAQILQAELGLEPTPETRALAERIRAADAGPRHNLPSPLTQFVGRQAELAQIAALLARPDCRLLALVGPGGVGKTRLALEVAERIRARFLDGVWLVPLVEATSAGALPLAIAGALHFTIADQSAPELELLNYLRAKEMLLLLDNFESLRGDGGQLAEIARGAPQVKVLITARERPSLGAAWAFEVGGLDVPADDAPESVAASSAGQLFVIGARRARYDFTLGPADAAAVRRICALVEGLPLALELAAPRVGSLPCAELLAAIEQSIDVLAGASPDLPRRHRSVRAVIDSSWELLAPGEQTAFSRLSVFHTSFTWQAAAEVAGTALPVLAALVDRSLARRAPGDRYALHELLRQYAHDRLAATPALLDETAERHAGYYARLWQAHEPALSAGDPRAAIGALEADWGNVRAAWQWAVAHARRDLLQSIGDSAFWWCQWSNRFIEGKALFELAVQRLIGSEPPREPWLAGLLVRYGRFCTQLADYDAAQAAFARSVPILREADLGEAERPEAEPPEAERREAELAQALDFWGDLERQQGSYGAARLLLEESVRRYRGLGAPAGLARALGSLSALVTRQGEYDPARRQAEESLALYRRIGNRWGTAAALYRLGYVAYELGEFALAERYYTESLAVRRELGDRWGVARTYNNLGIVFHDIGNTDQAERYFQECLALRQELGDRRGTAVALNNLGLIAESRRDYARAEQLYRQSLNLCRQIGNQQGVTIALNSLGEIAAAQERYEEAYAYHQESLAIARQIGYRRSVSFALEYLGLVALNLSRPDEARQYFAGALQLAWQTRAMPRVLTTLYGLARYYQRTGNAAQAEALARIVAGHPAAEEHARSEAAALLAELGAAAPAAAVDNEALEAAVQALLRDVPAESPTES